MASNDDPIAERLHAVAIHLLRSIRHVDSESGLTGPRLSALSVVVFAGPISLSDLAAAEQVRPATMSRLVDALVAGGYATREKARDDRRAVRIKATPEGRTLLTRGRRRRLREISRMLRGISGRERTTLEQTLTTLERALRAQRPS